WKPSLIIRNPAARPRRGVVEVDLLTTIADEPVGPGSAGGVPAAQAALRVVLAPPQITNIPVVQLLGSRIRRERPGPARHYPDNDLVSAWRAVVLVEDAVPGYGLRSYELREAETARRPGDEEVNAGQADEEPHAFAPAEAGHDARGFWLRNDVLQVTVDTNGIVSLAVDGSPRVPDLLGFEWVADVGDLYTHQAAGAISEERRFLGARVRHHGPLRAELELSFAIRVPRSSRDTRRVELPLRLVLRA